MTAASVLKLNRPCRAPLSPPPPKGQPFSFSSKSDHELSLSPSIKSYCVFFLPSFLASPLSSNSFPFPSFISPARAYASRFKDRPAASRPSSTSLTSPSFLASFCHISSPGRGCVLMSPMWCISANRFGFTPTPPFLSSSPSLRLPQPSS